MVIHRGDIYWVQLAEPDGSELGHAHPSVVIQEDVITRSRIHTVVVAILTSNLALAQAPGNVLVRSRYTGLPKDSVVNVSQLLTVDKRLLSEKLRTLDSADMARVDDGLRLVLAV